jgi:hypothetical protein
MHILKTKKIKKCIFSIIVNIINLNSKQFIRSDKQKEIDNSKEVLSR